jgi:hypothetical protein
MFIGTKIAIAAALVAASTSAAFAEAEFDWNLANRYPAYADPIGGATISRGGFTSAPVELRSGRGDTVIQYGTTGYSDPFEVDRADRASSPYAGGN